METPRKEYKDDVCACGHWRKYHEGNENEDDKSCSYCGCVNFIFDEVKTKNQEN